MSHQHRTSHYFIFFPSHSYVCSSVLHFLYISISSFMPFPFLHFSFTCWIDCYEYKSIIKKLQSYFWFLLHVSEFVDGNIPSSQLYIFAFLLHIHLAVYRCMLTHWGRDKMTAIFQTTFWNGFSWMKMYFYRLKFHWNLFLRVKLTIFRHWFR